LKKNKLILREFIDAVFYLADQEHPFNGYYGSFALLKKGHLVEFLIVLKTGGPILENHVNSAKII
jgi:hypothetical protein